MKVTQLYVPRKATPSIQQLQLIKICINVWLVAQSCPTCKSDIWTPRTIHSIFFLSLGPSTNEHHKSITKQSTPCHKMFLQ